MDIETATCPACHNEMQAVRPGKHQCNHCEAAALSQSPFFARLVKCMQIQNAKNQGTHECAEWIAQDRQFALKTALNQLTAGIGIMVIAGVDPEQLLTRWMNAVENVESIRHHHNHERP